MTAYMKALVPFVVGLVVCVVDKLMVGDVIPDEVWLTLFATAPVVAAVPNKPAAVTKRPPRRKLRSHVEHVRAEDGYLTYHPVVVVVVVVILLLVLWPFLHVGPIALLVLLLLLLLLF